MDGEWLSSIWPRGLLSELNGGRLVQVVGPSKPKDGNSPYDPFSS